VVITPIGVQCGSTPLTPITELTILFMSWIATTMLIAQLANTVTNLVIGQAGLAKTAPLWHVIRIQTVPVMDAIRESTRIITV